MSATLFAPRITPFLWFNSNASEAVDLYVSLFANSRRHTALPTPDAPKQPLVISFELNGQPLTAFNGGPGPTFNDAISLVVGCESQQEIDFYWSRLTENGGKEVACGWLKDRFGLSWQIVPSRIGELIRHPKAMQAMMSMKKLNIAELEQAANS